MIAAALLTRAPSVQLEGSPVSPPDRFAAVIFRHRVTILKAGSTFLRMVMTGGFEGRIAQHDLSCLRLGTFCAEPVNESVHRFAIQHLTPNYINSYWATEHGGMVWSRCHDRDEPIVADARCWPLPWIDGEVLVPVISSSSVDDEADGSLSSSWKRAEDDEQGEVVIRAFYPYLALTVWSAENFGDASWRGDLDRWRRYFSSSQQQQDGSSSSSSMHYYQGDAAVRHADGAFTFRGRSDEVINVGGNRIGTAEIETALLLDRELPDSSVLNCVVVGVPDVVLGSTPSAFIVAKPPRT